MFKKNLSTTNLMMLLCMLVMGYWAYSYSQNPEAGYFPYLILLLCPLMHFFMHGGHGEHKESDD